MKKILVALDGSETSLKALDVALDLAEKYSAEIDLLSVLYLDPRVFTQIPSLEGEIHLSLAGMNEFVTRMEASHKKILLDALDQVTKKGYTIKVSTKLVEGRPADKIVEAAKEGNFDLIVVGSRGLGGIKELFLGSVSDRVADHAPCPILIVK